ncbi:MAG: DNA adenine methylase [Thermoguttaceae bacterium]|nr:DNA adenine methylase [Thermoguttaceae bacterium]
MKVSVNDNQYFLFDSMNVDSVEVLDIQNPFPSTRYQGSKNKLSSWIWDCIQELHFQTVLDAFGGTGSISHMLKRKGKTVTYNDILTFNSIIGKALIENSTVNLPKEKAERLFFLNPDAGDFIQRNFSEIFYTDEENRQLDNLAANITALENEYQRALAWFSLFQACIAKRPYNLFHRANLYLRLSDVKRSFGNKITWDKPLKEHFFHYLQEANRAVFDNGFPCRSLNSDVFALTQTDYDLVYIDTPYISSHGVGTNYLEFYHFLEGMVHYTQWPQWIQTQYKHKPLHREMNLWTDKYQIQDNFDRLFRKFQNSILVISYRMDGLPSVDELLTILRKYKTHIRVEKSPNYQYVLSRKVSGELLLIAE